MLIFKTRDTGFIAKTPTRMPALLGEAPRRYAIADVTAACHAPAFLDAWRALLLTAQSPEKMYQTPDYVAFLQETSERGDDVHVFSIVEQESGMVVGVVPVRLIRKRLEFGAGSRVLARPALRAIVLLGSVALMPEDPVLLDQLLSHLFKCFPACEVISMQAMPAVATQARHIAQSPRLRSLGHLYVLFGWRRCHTIPLHASFDAYLTQMSAKKRYNLKRQLRLLEEHAGPLQLTRITEPGAVPLLMAALTALAPPASPARLMPVQHYLSLAAKGLLHCYALEAGGQVVALTMGTRSDTTLHLHNVYCAPALFRLSVGTSILYLAIGDLTTHFSLSAIDLGYGTPVHGHESTNVQHERGHLLYFRRTLKSLLLVRLHRCHVATVDAVKASLSRLRSRLQQRRGTAVHSTPI